MIFLWLSICCSIGIYFLFKIRDRFDVQLSHSIIINYFTATVLGLSLSTESVQIQSIIKAEWLPFAFLIGALFVIMFYLIGISSEKAGISVTSMATRLSMILPILVSLLFFEKDFSLSKLTKLTITFVAVLLAITPKPGSKLQKTVLFLPFILFIGSGSIDSLVKVAQHLFVPEKETNLFSLSLFGISFLTSLLLLFKKEKNRKMNLLPTLLFGITLGLVNFGSLLFLIKALNQSGHDSSLIFAINNLSIVCFSLIVGYSFFKERLSKLNMIGIIVSVFCLIILVAG